MITATGAASAAGIGTGHNGCLLSGAIEDTVTVNAVAGFSPCVDWYYGYEIAESHGLTESEHVMNVGFGEWDRKTTFTTDNPSSFDNQGTVIRAAD